MTLNRLFQKLGCHTTHNKSEIFIDPNETTGKPVNQLPINCILFLCVKPNILNDDKDFWSFLKSKKFAQSVQQNIHIVSVLAGVPISALKTSLDKIEKGYLLCSVSRIMPNTACGTCAGTIGVSFYCGPPDNEEHYNPILIELLKNLGLCQVVKEKQLDAVCGLAGSGIAFVSNSSRILNTNEIFRSIQ